MVNVQSQLDVVVKARAEGLATFDNLNRQVGKFRRSLIGANFVLKLFGLTLASVLGGALIRGLIRQQEELSKSLGRTRFFLAGFSEGAERGLVFANMFADSIERAGLATSNLAREIGAKAIVALKDEERATRFATAALVGHKLQLFDATAALNALSNSSEGNTQAFRTFLAALGIAAPEFASLDSLIENFIKRNQDAQQELTEFGRAWTELKGILAQRGAEIGAILAQAFTPLLNVVTDILKDPTEGFKNFFRIVIDGFKEAGDVILQFIEDAVFDPIIDALEKAKDGVIEWAKQHEIAAIIISGAILGVVAKAITTYILLHLQAIAVTNIFSLTAIVRAIRALIAYAITIVTKTIVAIKAHIVALFAQIATMLVANATMLITIGIWILAGIIVVALAVLIIKNWDKIKEVTLRVWGAIKDFFNKIWDSMGEKVSQVITFIKDEIFGLISVVSNAISAIGNLIGKIKEFISEKAKAAFGFARGLIPGFADGGIVTRPTLGLVGEAGPEAIIPLDRLGGIGGTTINLTITGNTFMSDEDVAVRIGDMIVKRLQLVHRIGLTT